MDTKDLLEEVVREQNGGVSYGKDSARSVHARVS